MLDRQSNYLERLIDGLVTLATFSARQGTLQLRRVPFESVMDDTLALAQFRAARKGITLEAKHQVSLPVLALGKERVSEAILHVIDNSMKFSPEGSRVVVQTGTEKEVLVVRVIDWGPGIPADRLDTI